MGVQADGNLYEDLTLEDNLITWARLFGASAEAAATRCREVIDQFGIGDRAKDPVGALSKGLRQRALIARAVLHRPEMLFLDEPMTGLDPEAADDLLRYLIDLRAESQCSLVVCTHQLRGIGQLCDRVVILDQGQVAESGGIADLVRTGWDSTPVHLRLSGRADDISAALLSSAAVGAADERGGGVWEIALKDETKLPELVCRLIQSGIDVWEVTPTVRTVRDLYFRALKGTEA
jgi:ABC-2 type transport system ATP-binding protein